MGKTNRRRNTNKTNKELPESLPSSSSGTTTANSSKKTTGGGNGNGIEVLAVMGLRKKEWKLVAAVLTRCANTANVAVDWESAPRYNAMIGLADPDDKDGGVLYGNTGRIVVLRSTLSSVVGPIVEKCHKQLAEILTLDEDKVCNEYDFFQPVYFHTQSEAKVVRSSLAKAIINKGREKGLFHPFSYTSKSTCSEETAAAKRFLPSQFVRINQNIFDTAPDPFEMTVQAATQERKQLGVLPFPDWGTIAVLDDLVSDELRARLLRVVLGEDESWDDTTQGPNPNRWDRNGVTDYPGITNNNWGMAGLNLYDILMGQHPAMEEMETLLAELFCDYRVERLPLQDLHCTPININAPTRHDTFSIHFDTNPLFLPLDTMFCSLFGKYNNRAVNRPLFVSVLVYLMEEWKDEWGAPTSFRKFRQSMAHKEDDYKVQAKPARVVVMESDIWHSVNPPTDQAGERPRYSMVWRLILYPKTKDQSMRQSLHCGRDWPQSLDILN